MKKVALFTIKNCKWCNEAKTYLKSKNINFIEIDLAKNRQAQRDCKKHKCNSVPTFLIGEDWICGFDKIKINKALGVK